MSKYLTTKEVRVLVNNWFEDAKPYGKYPYTFHLQSVELMVRKWFYLTIAGPGTLMSCFRTTWLENLCQAALLHDAIEDIEGMSKLIMEDHRINPTTIDLVDRVTDAPKDGVNNRLQRHKRAWDLMEGDEPATFLKLCDSIVNVEFSIIEESKLLQMYQKEFPKFEEQVRKPEQMPNLEPVWDHLKTILSTFKYNKETERIEYV